MELRREEQLREKYGELLSLDALAEAFGARSRDAIRRAHSKDQLPVELVRVPFKRGYFARVRDVARALESQNDWTEPVRRRGAKEEP